MERKGLKRCKVGTGDCEVSQSAKSCIHCRYTKCLNIGMNPELLRGKRKKEEERRESVVVVEERRESAVVVEERREPVVVVEEISDSENTSTKQDERKSEGLSFYNNL